MTPTWLVVVLAFIAPMFALGGVVIGAWMQRRTSKDQIDAQRKKDQESWRREDAHRFVDEKREIYGEIVARLREEEVNLNEMTAALAHAMQAIEDSEASDSEAVRADLLKQRDYIGVRSRANEQNRALMARLELVAPLDVRMLTLLYFAQVASQSEFITQNRDGESPELSSAGDIIRAMRHDLGYPGSDYSHHESQDNIAFAFQAYLPTAKRAIDELLRYRAGREC